MSKQVMSAKMNRRTTHTERASGKRAKSSRPVVDPQFLNAFLAHGWMLLGGGREEEAMEIAQRAVRLQETTESKAFFAHCLKKWSYFPGAEDMRGLIVRALREVWGKPTHFSGITMGLLERDPVVGPAIRRATAAWPRRPSLHELLGPTGLASISHDPLLIAWLEAGKLVSVDFERFLTSLRAGLLDLATQDRGCVDAGALPLCCALAQQCYVNEYVFDMTADERSLARVLEERISAAFERGTAIAPAALAVLSAYVPLDCLPEKALLRRSWPQHVFELLRQQVHAPAAERQQRVSIPRITRIADATSIAVQEQYEKYPYPRWVAGPPAAAPVPVDEWFREKCGFTNFRSLGKTAGLDVLYAGCGTGQHAIHIAQLFAGCRVLAVDLSMSSLCYAKEKTRATGLDNIEYAQADILELGDLGRTFDVISSCGTLHHLAEPEVGWRVLLSLLRPDGCMQVGLYSELARRDIVVAQQWLARHGMTPALESLRRGRQELVAAATTDAPLKTALKYPDFYSTSECRDLLLPARETRYTIPQIKAFLDQNGLEFLGFVIDGETSAQFRETFPGQSIIDLGLWHEFETRHPDTFKFMYEFWVQKKRPAF